MSYDLHSFLSLLFKFSRQTYASGEHFGYGLHFVLKKIFFEQGNGKSTSVKPVKTHKV